MAMANHLAAGGGDGCDATGSEVTNAREATHLTNVAEGLGSEARADPEQLGQRGFRRSQGEGQVPLESLDGALERCETLDPHPARIGDDRRRIAARTERWVERA